MPLRQLQIFWYFTGAFIRSQISTSSKVRTKNNHPQSSSTSPNNNMKEQWTTNNQLLLEDQCDQHGTAECVRYYRPACVYAVNLPLFQAAVPEAAGAPQQQQARQSCNQNVLTNHDTLSNAKATIRPLSPSRVCKLQLLTIPSTLSWRKMSQ